MFIEFFFLLLFSQGDAGRGRAQVKIGGEKRSKTSMSDFSKGDKSQGRDGESRCSKTKGYL